MMKLEDQPVAPQQTHTYVCPTCGETIDPGDLGKALYHARTAHRYDQWNRPRAGVAGASLTRAWNATDSNSRS
jgi:hypothetical protein